MAGSHYIVQAAGRAPPSGHHNNGVRGPLIYALCISLVFPFVGSRSLPGVHFPPQTFGFDKKSHLQGVACSAAPTAAVPPVLQRSDSLDYSTALSLDNIRQSLIRQEDTIIFSLIERAQFATNEPVYQSGAIAVPGKPPFRPGTHFLLSCPQHA